jgi:hypothetical protein
MTDPAHLLRQVRRWLKKSCPGAVVVNHAATLIVYLPDPAHDADALTASLGGPLRDIVKWHCEAAPMIAIGPVCTRLEDYQPAREQGYRGTLAEPVEETDSVRLFAEADVPWDALRPVQCRGMLKRFFRERAIDQFGVYSDVVGEPSVARLRQDRPSSWDAYVSQFKD